MSNVQAATMESAENMELLREAALQAGADTAFSATEAAAGIEALAKAGVSTEDVLAGGLAGALDLAAAGGIDVATAAETAASAMTQFGLAGDDVTHIADLLAAGAGKAQGSVHDMGQALNQAGLVANQTGLSIEETVGALTAFASAGLTGSDAGTSLKTMLQRLTPQSEQAAEQFEALGISAYDANGNFVGLADFAGQLQGAMAGLTPEARNAAMAVMFGSDAVRAAAVLFEEGSTGVQQWTTAVDDAGYAAEVASTRMDNLFGDWEEFTGSLETALIGAGEGADGPLRSLVQSATDAVNVFSGLPPAVQQSTVAIAGGGGLALLGVAGMVKLVTSISDAKTSLSALGLTADATKGKLTGLAAAAGTVAAVGLTNELMKMSAAAQVAQVDVEDLADDLGTFSSASGEVGPALADLLQDGEDWARFRTEIHTTEDAVTQFGVNAREALGANFWDQVDRFLGGSGDVAAFKEQVAQLDAALAAMVDSGRAETAADAFEQFSSAAVAQGVPIEDLVALMPQYAAATEEAGAAQESLAVDVDFSTGAVDRQIVSLGDLLDLQREAAGIALSESAATIAMAESIDAATASLEENGATLDLNTTAGRANRSALDDIAASSWDLIEAMENNGATAEELRAKTENTRAEFIETATQMGMNADQANALADEYGLIPSRIQTTAELRKAQAEADLATLAEKVRALPDGVVSISTVGYSQTYQYLSSIQSLMNSIDGRSVRVAMGPGGSGGTTFNADGGLHVDGVRAYADGGIDAYGNHVPRVPQIVQGGRYVMWAEQETGWEAYISGKPGMKARNLQVWADAGRLLGVQGLADGGMRGAYQHAATSLPVVNVTAPAAQFPSSLTLRVGDRQFTAYVEDIAAGEIEKFDRDAAWDFSGRR